MDRERPNEDQPLGEGTTTPAAHDDKNAAASASGIAEAQAWQAIQQNDPGKNAQIDIDALRAKVAEQIEQEDRSQYLTADSDDAIVTPLHHAEIRRVRSGRRRWIAVAAVAAAVATAGGGGYAIGALGSGDSDTTADVRIAEGPSEGTLPFFNGQSGEGAGRDGAATEQADSAAASGPADPSRLADSDSAASGGGDGAQSGADLRTEAWNNSRFRFTDGGLSTVGGRAEGWGFDVAQVATKKTAQRAADVFGVEGKIKADDWGWSVGDGENGAQVNVSKSGNLSYYDMAAYDEGTSQAKPIGTKKMQKIVLGYLTDLGIDTTGAVFNVENEDYGDSNYRWISLSLNVGGAVTEMSWSGSFVGDKLSDLNGDLASAVSLGEYEVISPAKALERLNDPGFSVGRWPSKYPTWLEEQWNSDDYYRTLESQWNQVPVTPEPGTKLTMPIVDVTLSRATLGLATYYDPTGVRLLLPTYELSDGSGAAWQVLAIADAHIDTATN